MGQSWELEANHIHQLNLYAMYYHDLDGWSIGWSPIKYLSQLQINLIELKTLI